MNKTKIPWTEFTSNPWKQTCRHGCHYCYAKGLYPRCGYSDIGRWDNDTLIKIYSRKKPSTIFMGSMTDLLGAWVPSWVIENILVYVKESPQHTFQFLTKNPARYKYFDWPENCWLGASVTNQEQWLKAAWGLWDQAGDVEHRNIQFISCEPLLERVDLWTARELDFVPDWMIIGPQTKPTIQPKAEWVEHLHLIMKDTWDRPIFHKPELSSDLIPGKIHLEEYPIEKAP